MNAMYQQLELGEFLKQRGMKRALNHAERHHVSWGDRALSMLRKFPKSRFQAEELRAWSYGQGLPEPPHGRAWGSVMLKAKNMGLIRCIGYQNVSNPNAHRTPAALWIKI
ncbi:MAG: hypothetical protein ABIK15_07195 [Pseudomonadota bacterium]